MQIFGPFRVAASQAAQGSPRINDAKPNAGMPASESSRATSPVDELDLSQAAGATQAAGENSAVAGGGEIRLERVASLRRAIADGTYETPEKLDVALNRMLDDFA